MTGLVTMTSKRQITIPVEMAMLLGWERGDRLWARHEGSEIRLGKAVDSWEDLQGIALKTRAGRKYRNLSAEKIIKLAGRVEAKRLANET